MNILYRQHERRVPGKRAAPEHPESGGGAGGAADSQPAAGAAAEAATGLHVAADVVQAPQHRRPRSLAVLQCAK